MWVGGEDGYAIDFTGTSRTISALGAPEARGNDEEGPSKQNAKVV